MKKYSDQWRGIFRNNNLTDLALIRDKKKKGLGNNLSTLEALTHILEDFGISVFGAIKVPNTELEFRYVWIDKKIPLENEELLRQLYGYENITVDVGVSTEGDKYQISFGYNTKDFTCELRKNVFSRVEKRKVFPTFAEMILKINSTKDVDKWFK